MIRRPSVRALGVLAVLGLGLAVPAGLVGQNSERGARWYMGNYSNEILVWDEATEEVVDRIPVKRRISLGVTLSQDRSRLYVMDPFFETIEIIDLPSKRSIGEFTLSEGRTRTWINSFEVHPSMEWAAILAKSRTKLVDRYEISEPVILRYDLTTFEVTDTIPWPDEEQREFANFRFSPDGELLYMFTDDLIALDSEDFTEIDRWEISEPFEPGLGEMSLPFGRSPYQEKDGVYTGLFRMTDPVQNRRLMGIATVDMVAQNVEFHPIGPSEGVSFTISPAWVSLLMLSQLGTVRASGGCRASPMRAAFLPRSVSPTVSPLRTRKDGIVTRRPFTVKWP